MFGEHVKSFTEAEMSQESKMSSTVVIRTKEMGETDSPPTSNLFECTSTLKRRYSTT